MCLHSFSVVSVHSQVQFQMHKTHTGKLTVVHLMNHKMYFKCFDLNGKASSILD